MREYNPQGISNALDWTEYMSVYFVSKCDQPFADEWRFMVSDENFHMPVTPNEWDRLHKIQGF